MDEETGVMKFAEEFNMPSTEDLKSLETWANVSPSILKVGRTTHLAPEHLSEEDKEAYLA